MGKVGLLTCLQFLLRCLRLLCRCFVGVRGHLCHSDGNSVDSYCPMLGYVLDCGVWQAPSGEAGVVPVHRAVLLKFWNWSLVKILWLKLAIIWLKFWSVVDSLAEFWPKSSYFGESIQPLGPLCLWQCFQRIRLWVYKEVYSTRSGMIKYLINSQGNKNAKAGLKSLYDFFNGL